MNQTESKKTTWVFVLLAAVLLLGLAVLAFSGYKMAGKMKSLEETVSVRNAELEAAQAELLAALTARPQNTASEEDAVTPAVLYESAKRQVVGIRSEITGQNFFEVDSPTAVDGTGFAAFDGEHVLTLYSVIKTAYDNQRSIEIVTCDRKIFPAEVEHVDKMAGIAILKVEDGILNPVAVGDNDTISVGVPCYAVGCPTGDAGLALESGRITAKEIRVYGSDYNWRYMLGTDLPLNRIWSGGPLYDTQGRVIGMMEASRGPYITAFAIPVNEIMAAAEGLMQNESADGRVNLGVRLDNRYDSIYSKYYGMPTGAFVTDILPDSPAEKAGIQPGDIITEIDGIPVYEASDLQSALLRLYASQTVEVSVSRADDELRLTVDFEDSVSE